MSDLVFLSVFLAAWVFMSYVAKLVFRGNRELTLAGVCMASLAAFCLASFVSGSVRAIGNALNNPYEILQLAETALFYVFIAGILAVIGVFLFFAVPRGPREVLVWIKVWRARALMKKCKKCIAKAERLAEMGRRDEAEASLEEAQRYSDEVKRLIGMPIPQERGKRKIRPRKKTRLVKFRRLKKEVVGRKKTGYVEWKNEGVKIKKEVS